LNGYNFSDRVRKVLQLAREEASRLHHEYVETEHILLGLIREGEGIGATVLKNLHVDLEEITEKIEYTVGKGKSGAPAGPDLPYTSRAKKILELAMSEARQLEHTYVGTEHLLLGTIAEEKGMAAQVLKGAGVTLEAARDETLRVLAGKAPDERARRVIRLGFGEARTRRTAIVARASELVRELAGQPPPDTARVREIGTELKALLEELAGLI